MNFLFYQLLGHYSISFPIAIIEKKRKQRVIIAKIDKLSFFNSMIEAVFVSKIASTILARLLLKVNIFLHKLMILIYELILMFTCLIAKWNMLKSIKSILYMICIFFNQN